MNPLYLSYLQSLQTKSQDAQNPGLWVNGRRMPTNLNEMFPPGQERDTNLDVDGNDPHNTSKNQRSIQETTSTKATAKYYASVSDKRINPNEIRSGSEEQDNPRLDLDEPAMQRPISFLHTDTVRGIQKQTQDEEASRLGVTAKANPNLADRMKQDPRNHAALIRAGKMTQEEANRSNMLGENTNRSMFLTHLQAMQTKSQGAQNPGLWVNGMRQPIREENAGKIADAPKDTSKSTYTNVRDTPEDKVRREEERKQQREIMNKRMKDEHDKENNYRKSHPSYLRPVITDPNEPKFIDPPNS